MLSKFLNVHKLTPFSRREPQPKPLRPPQQGEEPLLVLKIVHVGGVVERYYMAIPATRVLYRYPSFVLAKPEVFVRPWDSVVRPNQILAPGEKFFLVPRRTLKKLRLRIREPNKNIDASVDLVSRQSDISNSSVLSGVSRSAVGKKSGITKHVRFVGIDTKLKSGNSSSPGKKGRGLNIEADSCAPEKKVKDPENSSKSSDSQSQSHHAVKRRVKNAELWQPTLTSINETQGNW